MDKNPKTVIKIPHHYTKAATNPFSIIPCPYCEAIIPEHCIGGPGFPTRARVPRADTSPVWMQASCVRKTLAYSA